MKAYTGTFNALNSALGKDERIETESERKDRIIACTVKRGGCEVQTGAFRRVDCGE